MVLFVVKFEVDYFEYCGCIYWEMILFGLFVKQIYVGGMIIVGNMMWMVKFDVYFVGFGKINDLIVNGMFVGLVVLYVMNQLMIMVCVGNLKCIVMFGDFVWFDVVFVMLNLVFEGVVWQICVLFVKVGGDVFVCVVYDDKVCVGMVEFMYIYYWEMVLFLMQGCVDVGVLWQFEVVFQEQVGYLLMYVDILVEQNMMVIYVGVMVKDVLYLEVVCVWFVFIWLFEVFGIFWCYGFG